MVRGNFDACLQLARGLAWDYPVALVNSVNPVRLQGQKTASFEIVDFLGDAPDHHLLPVGNAGNVSAYWLGYHEYLDLGMSTRKPRMRGFQAEGAAPLVTGEPFPDPETKATAIRIGNPASWKLAEAARDESGGGFEARLRRPDPRRPARAGRQDGVFVEPASAAGVAGLLAELAAGRVLRRQHGRHHRHRSRPQGHRHRARGLRPAGRLGRRRRRGRGRRGRRPAPEWPRRGPVGSACRDLGQPRPRLRLARPRARPARRPRGRGARRLRRGRRGHRRGRRRGAARRDATSWSAPCGRPSPRSARTRPACGCAATTSSRTPAASAPPRPPSSAASRWPGPSSPTAPSGSTTPRSSTWPSAIEGHPDNVAPAVLGGFVIAGPTSAGRLVRRRRAGATPASASWSLVPPDAGLHRAGPRPAAGDRAARRRRRRRRPHRAAGRRAGRRAPSSCCAATRDRLHQDYRRPAMPASLALVDALRAEGVPAVVSGAGPTRARLRAADARRSPAALPRRLGRGTGSTVDHRGARGRACRWYIDAAPIVLRRGPHLTDALRRTSDPCPTRICVSDATRERTRDRHTTPHRDHPKRGKKRGGSTRCCSPTSSPGRPASASTARAR